MLIFWLEALQSHYAVVMLMPPQQRRAALHIVEESGA